MQTIKYLFRAVRFTLLAALLLPLLLHAQTPAPLTRDAKGSIDIGTTNSYAVISANGIEKNAPTITFLSATSDLSTSTVLFHRSSNPTLVRMVNNTTAVPVVTTNGFTAGDVVILRHTTSDTYERRGIASLTATNSIVLDTAPTAAMAAGDMVYKATTAGFIPVGNTTITLNGPGIYSGQRGLPLLLQVNGTSACQINAVCATFDP